MIGPLSYLDIVLIVLGFISGMLALYRGLSREILSLVAWVAAAGATFYFVFFHRDIAEQLGRQMDVPAAVPLVGIGALIFLVVLVPVHLITIRISDAILDRQLGMIDRILGFGFGVARAFLIVVIFYMLALPFRPNLAKELPWVAQSYSYPSIQATSRSLGVLLLTLVERINPDLDPNAPDRQQQG
ncbi:MAG: CvpA family protein [Pseudomonadota bacterium]